MILSILHVDNLKRYLQGNPCLNISILINSKTFDMEFFLDLWNELENICYKTQFNIIHTLNLFDCSIFADYFESNNLSNVVLDIEMMSCNRKYHYYIVSNYQIIIVFTM